MNCNGCTACCRNDVVVVEDDEAHRYRWHFERGMKVLDRRYDGACVYLAESGCSIHDNKPRICDRFDCRALFLATPKSVRKRRIVENPTMRFVYAAGKARLATLRANTRSGPDEPPFDPVINGLDVRVRS